MSDNDRAYLLEKMAVIHTACVEYDVNGARTVLAELRKKTWPRPVKELLETIARHLLHSEFTEAANIAGTIAVNLPRNPPR
jgi:hypothetical protein